MNQAKKALIVVDMQPNYETCINKELQRRIYHKIYEYMEACLPIMIVEYRDYQTPHDVEILNADDFNAHNEHERTIACLWNEVKDYPFMQVVSKWNGDGSRWIGPVIVDKHGLFYKVKLFEIVGINLQLCVAATATGLAGRFSRRQFEILYDYCSGLGCMEVAREECLRELDRHCNNNLALVERNLPDVKMKCGRVQEFSLENV